MTGLFRKIVHAATMLVLSAMLPFVARAETVEDKAKVCATCHGENGVPIDKNIPIIWGQHQGYLYLQLRDFKRGTRMNEQMAPFAESLDRDDMMALAEYFSKLKWPNLQQPPAPPNVVARAQQANASVGCTGCHQGEYQGEGTQPRLAGQNKDYQIKSMLDFRTRARANNPGMSDLMISTSVDDLQAMAEYLAGL
jgi:cytochrome c553